MGIRKIFFLFLHENICCGYSLEVPHRGTSNEYPQHMFSWRNKKNINTFGIKKESYQDLWMFLKYCWMSGQQCRPWSDVMFRRILHVWSGSALFAQACLSQYLGSWQYSVKECMFLFLPKAVVSLRARSNSAEANWSGSALFAITYVNLYQQTGSSNLIGWNLEVGMAT